MLDLDSALEPAADELEQNQAEKSTESEYMQYVKPTMTKGRMIGMFAGVAVLGILTGVLAWNFAPTGGRSTSLGLQSGSGTVRPDSEDAIQVGAVFGNPDDASFRDAVEGVLLEGGANGEGSHRIVREGGETQTVYLTSSVLDLNMFVNHAVTVKGETFRAQNAGWLMDVGQLKIDELNASLPAWVENSR